MAKFRNRLFLSILIVTVLTGICYLLFLFQISLRTEQLNRLPKIAFSVLTIIVLAIVSVGLISLFFARAINRPIRKLIQAHQAIARRDFDQHLKIHTFQEIEELISSFNYMVEQLKNYKDQLSKQRQNLERIAQERTRELSYIYCIGREVSSSLELEEVLDTISKRTAEVLDLKICAILLIDEVIADKLRVMCAQGINLKKIERQTIRKGEGISGWVLENKEAILVNDLEQDERFIARTKERYYTGSIISVPIEAKGKIIGVINANNKATGESFKKDDLLLLQEVTTESAMAIENALLYKSLKEIYIHTISALASALEAKDHYSRSHSENVTRYAVAIAEEMGLTASDIEVIRQACQLHDLGKIGIHDYILTKAGELSPEEWDEIKTHALRGAQILQPMGFLDEVSQLVKQHHERFDGKGYPSSLKGQDIQLGARIMTVADSFDAMISERPYRKALSLQQAIGELKTNSATQFDPGVVKAFLKLLEAHPDIIKQVGPRKKN
ncbi:MAG: HD domain-containing protein [Candidatus Omnitrophica bacterium]|nr:HD domain-containing protein [Candidatus Omnitrophota bacterium]